MLANHGRVSKFEHEIEGVNSRLDGIQGAVLNVKLRYLEAWTEARRRIAAAYDQAFRGREGVHTQQVPKNAHHVYHLYTLRTRRRDALRQWLAERDIASGIHYPVALPNLRAYHHLGHQPGDFPIASRNQGELLSLPIYPELTEEMIERVIDAVTAFCDTDEGRKGAGKANRDEGQELFRTTKTRG
jgi:dTDP-4-amino-4,6-dideoxygalactose transaminase